MDILSPFLLKSCNVLILSLICSFGTIAQVSDTGQSKYSTLGISGALFALSEHSLSSTDGHQYFASNPMFRLGLEASFPLGNRVNLTLGLNRYDLDFKKEYSWIYIQSNDPSIPMTQSSALRYLDVPIAISMDVWTSRKATFMLSAGAFASFLHRSEEKMTYADLHVDEVEIANELLSGGILSLAFQYDFNDRFAIKLAPHARIYFNALDDELADGMQALGGSISLVHRFDWACMFKQNAWRPTPMCID